MRALAAVLLTAPLAAPARPAAPQEDPYALPRDARSMLQWHLGLEPETSDWEDLTSRLFRYFQRSAFPEARATAARMLELDPQNPDAERFLIYMDLWADGKAAASAAAAWRWLALRREQPERAREEMARHRRTCQEEIERRRVVAARARTARWLPLAALLPLLLCIAYVARVTR